MKGIKLPSTLRWAMVNCLLLWIAMSLYRGFMVGIFHGKIFSKLSVIFQGMLIDAGVVAYFLALFVLLSFYTPFHPYKTKTGKAFGYIYFTFWMLFISVAFAMDLIFLKAVQFRAYGSKVVHLLSDEIEAEAFFRSVSLMPVVLITVLIVWIWALLIRWLHGYLGRMSRIHTKSKRLTWQGGVIIAGSLIAIITIVSALQITPQDLDIKTVPEKAFTTNPLLNLFFV